MAHDPLRGLIALGRTPSDWSLLDGALGELNVRHGLAAKIAAEPTLATIVTEFVTPLLDAFGTLAEIREQAVLDIACGSNSSRSPSRASGPRSSSRVPAAP